MEGKKYKEFNKNKKSLKNARNKNRNDKTSCKDEYSEDVIREGIYDDVLNGKIKNMDDVNKELIEEDDKKIEVENKKNEENKDIDQFDDAYFESVQIK
jgi:hypothetical protein